MVTLKSRHNLTMNEWSWLAARGSSAFKLVARWSKASWERTNFVLVRTKSPARPDRVLLLQLRKQYLALFIADEGRRRVVVVLQAGQWSSNSTGKYFLQIFDGRWKQSRP